MTSKTQTETYLRSVALPEQTDSYTVISHGDIIDTVRDMLAANGFTIKEELYKAEANGNIALGFMQLENQTDPDMGMTFNWANSYNKQVRFSCAIGGFIYDNSTPFVSGTSQGKWNRKHTGTALDETKDVIEAMIVSANDHFAEIIGMKEQFKSIKLSRKEYAKLSGLFFFDKMLISPEQVSVLRREYDKPLHDYSAKGTLWEYYKMLMLSVVDQSPKTWYKQQADISNYINILYSISKSPIAVGEADLEDTIVSVEEFTASEVIEKFSQHLSEEDRLALETMNPEEVVKLVTPETTDFVTDEEEDEVMDAMFAPIEPVKDPMESINNLIHAQNLIKEPVTAPIESMEEKVAPCAAHDQETEKEESILEYSEEVEEAPFNWEIGEGVEIQEEIVLPKAQMTEEQIELIQEEHGIIESGSPDDGLVGEVIHDEEVESLFEEMEEELEEVEEVPWFTDEDAKNTAPVLGKAPALIPDSMHEAVTDILENSYNNKRKIVNSVELEDSMLFELDSHEFFNVEK
jgi:hypothetical protein